MFAQGDVVASERVWQMDLMRGASRGFARLVVSLMLIHRNVATPWDWSQTRCTLSLGQSGHRFSPYRSNRLQAWLAVETHPRPWNGTRATPIGELDLVPAAPTDETDRP
ncbi:hypothetical protein ThidrDRAFT_2126 [Thiorhodococcus drewsii AZ1]|uniref:Uncharacterized protein n=1 Tax=Thiorhodococcus drewsii AZ1 TaxID=765913 RepID=G2E1G3_9GAMM|nr:hypothetical protein [Thiorhodococcus drewsii]EGV31260.1 hypothetical protein ThidrDRAFT_2126 [Thiorhodococcus drewsii AZ1]